MTEAAPRPDYLQTVEQAAEAPGTFVSNTERVLSPEPVKGSSALKTWQLVPREVWRDATPGATLVLPLRPGQDFLEYAASLGWTPEIVVPDGLDLNNLDITHGIDDPNFRQAIAGRRVDSYVPDATIYDFVVANGGDYGWGDPRRRPSVPYARFLAGDNVYGIVNDKSNFQILTEDILEVPDGIVAHGLDCIADAVLERLQREGNSFVRNVGTGGGFGNVRFDTNDLEQGRKHILTKLTADHPEIWTKATALVEEYVKPDFSPAITMHVDGPHSRLAYHSLQVSRNGDYVGMVSPVPESILATSQARQVAVPLMERLIELDYKGNIGLDCGVGKGPLVGYELNGRGTGSMHSVNIAEGLTGIPWASWRNDGVVTKAVDRYYLDRAMGFGELHEALDSAGLLASRESPHGAVISIAPAETPDAPTQHHRIAGVQVIAENYRQAHDILRRIDGLVGDTDKNWYDDSRVGTQIVS